MMTTNEFKRSEVRGDARQKLRSAMTYAAQKVDDLISSVILISQSANMIVPGSELVTTFSSNPEEAEKSAYVMTLSDIKRMKPDRFGAFKAQRKRFVLTRQVFNYFLSRNKIVPGNL
jgi:hypothetical protein